MAAVSCRRAFIATRWYDVSRVFSLSSTLTTTATASTTTSTTTTTKTATTAASARNHRNETWCRRWWHISHRSVSMSACPFAPRLSTILTKETTQKSQAPPRSVKSSKVQSSNGDAENSASDGSAMVVADVTVTYHRGLPRITLPLPSRKENCMFVLKPITHTVGDFLKMVKAEDRGIDRAIITTIDSVRISSSSTVETLLESNFKLIINDNEYIVTPPLQEQHGLPEIQKLSDVQMLIGQLYESLHVQEFNVEMERQVLAELESVNLELEPLQQKLDELEAAADKRADIFVYVCLITMSMQFGGLARLTWWEYSWDIMEPVTYFVTYGTAIACVIYFLVTKQEYMLPDVLHRRQLIVLHKRAKKAGLDIDLYNRLKDRAFELETTLKILRGPLYEHKIQMQQRKDRYERESSSSSRSPSSSPSSSPSPSPSPEKEVSKSKASAETNASKRSPVKDKIS